MGIITGYLSRLVNEGIKLTGGSPQTYTKTVTGTALTASWVKLVTTTSATKSLRMAAAPTATIYDIEYTIVDANASPPTDTYGMPVLASEDFAAGIPIGDIYVRSATLQSLIMWVA